MKRAFPDAKLIVCLRNPIDRAYSHYWMHRGSSKIRQDVAFEEAIAKAKFYIEMGFYSQQLQRYLEYYPRDQLLILLFEDMLNHPEAEIKTLLNALNVSTEIDSDLISKSYSNPAKMIRSGYMENILYSASRTLIDLGLSPLLNLPRKKGFYQAITKMNTAPFKYPEMNPQTRKHLRPVFKIEVSRLEKLLNRDLSRWQ